MAVWKKLYDLSESDRHAGLSLEAVGLWTYILGSTDSHGRRSAELRILKSKVMTLRANVTEEWISARLAELVEAGLIHLYTVDGRRFLVMHRISRYGATGALAKITPEYPPPPEDLCDCLVFHPKERLKEVLRPALESAAQAAQESISSSLSSSSLRGKEGMQGEPSGEKVPAYALSDAAGLVPQFSFCKTPSLKAKADAISDLLRQGVESGKISAYATSPEHRTWDFWDIVKAIKGRNGQKRSGLDDFNESMGVTP